MTRAVMWLLLFVVAGAAAVLSFAALRDLALLCGFTPGLAWLLPVVVDAGAAAGCLVWLGTGSTDRARVFARRLTIALLVSSVAGNAVVHYLTASDLRPEWWLVVLVSAVAPAVLGAVVHLAVLVGQSEAPGPELPADGLAEVPEDVGTPADPIDLLVSEGAGRRRVARELGVSEHQARVLLAERNGVTR